MSDTELAIWLATPSHSRAESRAKHRLVNRWVREQEAANRRTPTMPATATPTYTHVGHRPHTGYTHCSSRLYGHTDPKPGKRHALNYDTAAGYYRALCGEVVAARYSHPALYDDERPSTSHVAPATDAAGTRVTCRRCLRRLA